MFYCIYIVLIYYIIDYHVKIKTFQTVCSIAVFALLMCWVKYNISQFLVANLITLQKWINLLHTKLIYTSIYLIWQLLFKLIPYAQALTTLLFQSHAGCAVLLFSFQKQFSLVFITGTFMMFRHYFYGKNNFLGVTYFIYGDISAPLLPYSSLSTLISNHRKLLSDKIKVIYRRSMQWNII